MAPGISCPVRSTRYLQTEGLRLVEREKLALSPCLGQWGLRLIRKHNSMEDGDRELITGLWAKTQRPNDADRDGEIWKQTSSEFKHPQLGCEEKVDMWPQHRSIQKCQDNVRYWQVMVCLGFYWGSVEVIIVSLLGSGSTSCNGLFATPKF